MVTETNIITPKVVNETRFQFTRTHSLSNGNELPGISVASEFSTGGNGVGNTHDTSKHFELQNYTSISHGVHTIRFGVRVRRESDQSNQPGGSTAPLPSWAATSRYWGRTTRSSTIRTATQETVLLTAAQQYIRNLQLTALGLSQTTIQSLGGGPSRFNIQAGQSYVSFDRWDAGPFVQDDWRIKPNLTLSLGLRYEVQTLISEHKDIAPRIGFAWAPGKRQERPPEDRNPRRLRHLLRPRRFRRFRTSDIEQRLRSVGVPQSITPLSIRTFRRPLRLAWGKTRLTEWIRSCAPITVRKPPSASSASCRATRGSRLHIPMITRCTWAKPCPSTRRCQEL